MPDFFRINTARTSNDTATHSAGKVHAAIMSQGLGYSKIIVLSLFVEGPQAETTEGALRALLEKVEGMIGKRWKVGMMDRKNVLDS